MVETIAFTFLIFSLSSMSIIGVSMNRVKKLNSNINPLVQVKLDEAGRLLGARSLTHKKINNIQDKTAASTGSIELAGVVCAVPAEDKRVEA